MMNSRVIGIDLGTTSTVAAAVNQAGHTEILRTREGESLIPSVVLFTDDKTVVGESIPPEVVQACILQQVSRHRAVRSPSFN